MFTQFSTSINAKMHFQFFKVLLLFSNTLSLFLYAFLHFIFFDFPVEVAEEVIIVTKLVVVASGFALLIGVLIALADCIDFFIQQRKRIKITHYLKSMSLAMAAIVLLLYACKQPIRIGIKKDFNTGVSASYSGMEPEKVFLVMNNEVLNHTDIPLGESFLLINDGIKGLQVKNGKVAVGCSLQIVDSSGKVLLNEKDLFEGHDEFDEKDAAMLKCTVSTGKPMKWEEKYKVAVTFWDKNGQGKIENIVTIRSIDLP